MIIRRAPDEVRGRTALVTGASSGMGVDYARELARRGVNKPINQRPAWCKSELPEPCFRKFSRPRVVSDGDEAADGESLVAVGHERIQ